MLLFACLKNEAHHLAEWLAHYRSLGVAHFLIVDNGSTDGTAEHLAAQEDVSLWTARGSYKAARFGMDWLGALQWKFGTGHWCLTVDGDEFLTYADAPERSLPQLAAELDADGREALGALMLDLYPKGRLTEGGAPRWFDPAGYRYQRHRVFGHVWIQGGLRERAHFASEPLKSPTLNKVPFVRWRRGFAYVTSTHFLLPSRLNDGFPVEGASCPTGVLLHRKFGPASVARAQDAAHRQEHFENSAAYEGYYEALASDPDYWTEASVAYDGPDQLLALGLMDRGGLPVVRAARRA